MKALNAMETFRAHQVSTRTLCVTTKGIASKVENSRSANRAALRVLRILMAHQNDCNNISGRQLDQSVVKGHFCWKTQEVKNAMLCPRIAPR